MRVLFLIWGVLQLSCFTHSTLASEPDWSKDRKAQPSGNANPYGWSDTEFAYKVRQGQLHAVQYPVSVTGLLIPARITMKFLSAEPGEPLFIFMRGILKLSGDFKNFTGFWDWLGLHDYPVDGSIPYPGGVRPDYPLGVSLLSRKVSGRDIEGFTLSCAACHSANFFGKTILGMTNRFPRSNEFFVHGKSVAEKVNPALFQITTGASHAEKEMYRDMRARTRAIGLKNPSALGLDTSLSQVALSLSRRSAGTDASRSEAAEKAPRPNMLDTVVADSKPAVWWNVKYKNRYLSDGSVVSGNPIFTNFLWNEIGRGVDLPPLMDWLSQNSRVVEELTTAVFASRAPRWNEVFPDRPIQVARARRGQVTFEASCAKCHGTYHVAQDGQVATDGSVAVNYFEHTRTYNVGTDSGRARGMKALEDALNPLDFSRRFNIVIETTGAYVAPPLEGIFARYPYFHNNSIPNLCALMTAPEDRPVTYVASPALVPSRDFDFDCVGYPVGAKVAREWAARAEYHFDTRREGLSNSGHYERIFTDAAGRERFTSDQKQDLREYLKTL